MANENINNTQATIKSENPATTINVTISAEMASKLYMAFLGLPDQRRELVEKTAKENKQSIPQATFENILYPKLVKYEEAAKEKQEQTINNALQLLVATGKVKNMEAAKQMLEQLTAATK